MIASLNRSAGLFRPPLCYSAAVSPQLLLSCSIALFASVLSTRLLSGGVAPWGQDDGREPPARRNLCLRANRRGGRE